jgi:hypothetical protein
MGAIIESMSQSRRSTRGKVAIPARYESKSLFAEGLVTDISPEGLFFASDYLDRCGELVKIWIDVPWQEGPLELCGEVRWVSDDPGTGGMGVSLLDISLDDRMLLASLGLTAWAEAQGASSLGM